MSIGCRIYTKIDRPTPEEIEKIRNIPVANLDDNMGRIYAVDVGIKCLNGVKLCGPAFTVKAPSGDNLMFHRALELAQPGDVLVISGVGNSERSFCGELMYQYAVDKGLAGFVIDGCVRDLDGYQGGSMPVYARGIQANGPYKNGPGEINVPVALGGQVVMPGDVLVGDSDGLIVIAKKDLAEVTAAGQATLDREEAILADMKAGKIKPDERPWVAEKLAAISVEVI